MTYRKAKSREVEVEDFPPCFNMYDDQRLASPCVKKGDNNLHVNFAGMNWVGHTI